MNFWIHLLSRCWTDFDATNVIIPLELEEHIQIWTRLYMYHTFKETTLKCYKEKCQGCHGILGCIYVVPLRELQCTKVVNWTVTFQISACHVSVQQLLGSCCAVTKTVSTVNWTVTSQFSACHVSILQLSWLLGSSVPFQVKWNWMCMYRRQLWLRTH